MPSLGWSTGPSDPTLEAEQEQSYNTPIGYAGKYYKRLLKRIGRGDDVSSFGEFNTINQQHAANRRDISDSYGYGGNALIAQSGGEQANILNRMKQVATDKDYERQGTETGAELGKMRSEAAGGFQSAYDSARQEREAAMNNRLGYYADRNKSYIKKSGWDKFMDIVNAGAQTAGAFAGASGGGGGGGGCWIAEALYGIDDVRTHLLRHWIHRVWAVESVIGSAFSWLYLRFGERAASVVKRNRFARSCARIVFDWLLQKAGQNQEALCYVGKWLLVK